MMFRMEAAINATAGSLIRCNAISRLPTPAEPNGGGVFETRPAIPKKSANSGNAESGRNSASLSDFTNDRAFSRSSEIHRRKSAPVTGPYSLPSPPMMTYIKQLSEFDGGHADRKS